MECRNNGILEYWSNRMMHLPTIPPFHYSTIPFLLALILATGCDRLPGKPTPEERWRPATEVTDFSQLYAVNCAGCHGADGRLGAARPLNDPLYLALVSAATLRASDRAGSTGHERAGLGATGRRPAYRQADRHSG